MKALRFLGVALCALACACSPAKQAAAPAGPKLTSIRFATDWKAQAEHGGYYQAVADGTYAKHGLDVTIRPGGPQVNHSQLLAAGKIDFNMGGNLFAQFNYTQANVPMVTIAAIFQKEPQVLLAHPDTGVQELADLDEKTFFISNDGVQTYWLWLKQVYGYTDDQVKPYTFNPAPFLADQNSVQQGYVTSEPFAIEKQAGFKPKVFLIADYGFNSYSTLIETRRDLVEKKPELVQRFVDASAIGWYNYLYGDNKAANELIRRHNPEMTEEMIDYSIAKMKEFGIVDSGDSLKSGIGAMTDARMASFYDKMVRAGVVKAGLDFRKSYTLQFVNKGVGLDLRPR